MKKLNNEICKFKPNLKITLSVNIKNCIKVNYQLFFVIFKTFVLGNFLV